MEKPKFQKEEYQESKEQDNYLVENQKKSFNKRFQEIQEAFQRQKKHMFNELQAKQQEVINSLKKNFDLAVFKQKNKEREIHYTKELEVMLNKIKQKSVDLGNQSFKNILSTIKNPQKDCENATYLLNLFKTDLEQQSQTLFQYSENIHEKVQVFLNEFNEKQEQIQNAITEFINRINSDLEKVETFKNQIQDRLKTIQQCVKKIQNAFYFDEIKVEKYEQKKAIISEKVIERIEKEWCTEKAQKVSKSDIKYEYLLDTIDYVNDSKTYFFNQKKEAYKGQFYKGKRQGKGKQIFQNGSIFEGYFMNGQQNVFGRMIQPDGSYKIGFFQDDIPVKNHFKEVKNHGKISFDPEIIQKYLANGKVSFSNENRTFLTNNSSGGFNNCLLLGSKILKSGKHNWSLTFENISNTRWNVYGIMEASNIQNFKKYIDGTSKDRTYTWDHKTIYGLNIWKSNSSNHNSDSFRKPPSSAQQNGGKLDFEVDFIKNLFTISYQGKAYVTKKIAGLQIVPYFHIQCSKGFKATLSVSE